MFQEVVQKLFEQKSLQIWLFWILDKENIHASHQDFHNGQKIISEPNIKIGLRDGAT